MSGRVGNVGLPLAARLGRGWRRLVGAVRRFIGRLKRLPAGGRMPERLSPNDIQVVGARLRPAPVAPPAVANCARGTVRLTEGSLRALKGRPEANAGTKCGSDGGQAPDETAAVS